MGRSELKFGEEEKIFNLFFFFCLKQFFICFGGFILLFCLLCLDWYEFLVDCYFFLFVYMKFL